MKIHSTSDLTIFRQHEANRQLEKSRVQNLAASLERQNMLHLRPIIVDQDMRVIDGQHRLEAAKKVGAIVWYIMDDSASPTTMVDINQNQACWKLSDYLNFYVQMGKMEYIELQAFMDANAMSSDIALIWFTDGGKAAFRDGFRNGDFKCQMPESKQKIFEAWKQFCASVDASGRLGKKVFGRSVITSAFITFCSNKLIRIKQLLEQAEKYGFLFERRTTTTAYHEMFLHIYNYKKISYRLGIVESKGSKLQLAYTK